VTPTTEKTQPQPHKNKLAKRWMFVILLVLLLLTAAWVTPALSSYAPVLGNLLVTPSLTPTAAATAASTSTPTPTQNAAPSSTPAATATATSTSTPTPTQNAAPSSTPETTVRVSCDFVNLRAGPGISFTAVRQFTFGELLMLLGRVSDNTWLYVKTSDGQAGWVKTTSVDLAGTNLDYHPIEMSSYSPETTVTISGDTVNLRTGPGTNFSKVRALTYGEPLMLLGRVSDNTWLYVKTSDGQEGWVKTTWVNLARVNLASDYLPIETSPPTETSTPVVLTGIEDRWIDVDLSEQMIRAYDGTILVASFLVSTGLDLYPTEPGQYHIYAKMLFSDMRGADFFLPNVPYTMYYSGDFSIHGTYWHHSFGTPMSHGCVNMDTQEAEWLYNWASVGTLVNIHP